MLTVRRLVRRTNAGLVSTRFPIIRQTARLLTTTNAQTDRVRILLVECVIRLILVQTGHDNQTALFYRY
jgi:hypothetical protein